jgi:predicted N-acetyltransferase YhbS
MSGFQLNCRAFNYSRSKMMKIDIRREQPGDYKAVYKLTELAFRDLEISEHNEQDLVERLRRSSSFIPELSLVAVLEQEIVGHILLTRNKIVNDREEFESLTLAPVSVTPEHQNQGIGSQLIRTVLDTARELGFKSVFLVGHENYYPRFGFVPASKFGILSPFEVPDPVFMALELVPGGLKGVSGTIQYPSEFFEK